MMIKVITSLLFILLALFPFGQLTKIPLDFLNSPDIHLYLIDFVLFLLVSSWGVWRFFFEKKNYHLPPLTKPIFLFALIGGASLAINSPLFSSREVGVGFLYLLRWFFYAGLYFVLSDLKGKLPWLRKDWSCFLTIIGSAVGVLALVQYLLWPNLKALEVLQYDPHFYRAVGTFLDPGFTGLILALTLLLIIFSWFEQKKKYLIFLGLFLFMVLALTYSRASWLAFLIGSSLLSFYRKSWKLFLLIAGFLILTWFLIPQPSGEGGQLTRTYTIQARFENSQQALKTIKEKPFLGVGFNTLRYYQKNELISQAGAGVDNSWLFVLATTGIVGFMSYLWLWGKVLKISRGHFLVLSSLTVLTVHAFFLNSLFYPWMMIWFWFLVSLGVKENK